MDTILLATMILLTPFVSMWAFILSLSQPAEPLSENSPASRDRMPTPEQEAVSALNRIWGILLRPEEREAACSAK